ncbi:hypothetical protein FEM48_Zijuj09G0127900 [Ziziphus jujuba var. spinosa]|uniref:Protein kinase domain-containing protein n=1 Tax=Ziziphus jujuba var. spinosa TaxID=714518 RepID=A0A978UT35_ZIZJJ|nr:hypothetical protein FEM48_Zijuj09G0127900 [Ziziphus jujuba var. spinosa]
MSSYTKNLHFWWKVASFFVLLILRSLALNSDGVFLLAFKYSILSDPLLVLENWNYNDVTPCSWRGVTCTEIGFPGTPDMFRVTGLVLPNSQLLGSIAADLGKIQHLRNLDLSNNFFNGSLPSSIFNASELQVLSLSNNVISGELPESVGGLASLQVLNLSDNALAGKVPENLTSLQNLTVISLKSNYFSGNVPSGFNSVQVLDLSSNLLNGSLPLGFGGGGFRYLNLSYNKISGNIPPEFAKKIPVNATIDLSFNNLTGAIPETLALHNQKTEWFSGNADLCGKPLKNLCSIPSTLSTPPNDTKGTTSSPAIAAIPKTIDSTPVTNSSGTPSSTQSQQQSGLKPGTIAGIALGDVAGIAVVAIIILYVYQIKKGKSLRLPRSDPEKKLGIEAGQDLETMKPPSAAWSCLPIKGEETSEATSSDSDPEDKIGEANNNNNNRQTGLLMTVDGEPEMELETLLKASAYMLGASGASILYKALLEDGTALAVRRIGESRVERMRDFETQVKLIAKLRHPNLVRVRGFYWGNDEKLVIYDYVSNGSLASTTARRAGSSPCHLPLAVRLQIARGVARGLAYIHEKKHVHGNIKPSNILLNPDMEPIISDFGRDRLLFGNTRASGSARHLGSYSSTSRDGQQDFLIGGSPSGGSCTGGASPYQAPESLKNLKPNAKWDVFSFGIVLLELLTGRVFSERELSQWSGGGSMAGEERNRMLRMFDVAIRTEVENKEDVMLGCLKLGLSCACFVPQKRPTMKEALQVLDKIPSSSVSH